MDFDLTQPIDFIAEDGENEGKLEKKPVSYLKVFGKDGLVNERFAVYQGNNIIGRQEDICNIYLPVKSLSKQHACIEICGTSHFIYDMSSRNKTRRGKHYLTPEVRYELRDNDALMFADINSVYHIKNCGIIDCTSESEPVEKETSDSGSETGSELMFQIPFLDPSRKDASETREESSFSNVQDGDEDSISSPDSQPNRALDVPEQLETEKQNRHPPKLEQTDDESLILIESETDDEFDLKKTLELQEDGSSTEDKDLLNAPTQAFVLDSNSDLDQSVGLAAESIFDDDHGDPKLNASSQSYTLDKHHKTTALSASRICQKDVHSKRNSSSNMTQTYDPKLSPSKNLELTRQKSSQGFEMLDKSCNVEEKNEDPLTFPTQTLADNFGDDGEVKSVEVLDKDQTQTFVDGTQVVEQIEGIMYNAAVDDKKQTVVVEQNVDATLVVDGSAAVAGSDLKNRKKSVRNKSDRFVCVAEIHSPEQSQKKSVCDSSEGLNDDIPASATLALPGHDELIDRKQQTNRRRLQAEFDNDSTQTFNDVNKISPILQNNKLAKDGDIVGKKLTAEIISNAGSCSKRKLKDHKIHLNKGTRQQKELNTQKQDSKDESTLDFMEATQPYIDEEMSGSKEQTQVYMDPFEATQPYIEGSVADVNKNKDDGEVEVLDQLEEAAQAYADNSLTETMANEKLVVMRTGSRKKTAKSVEKNHVCMLITDSSLSSIRSGRQNNSIEEKVDNSLNGGTMEVIPTEKTTCRQKRRKNNAGDELNTSVSHTSSNCQISADKLELEQHSILERKSKYEKVKTVENRMNILSQDKKMMLSEVELKCEFIDAAEEDGRRKSVARAHISPREVRFRNEFAGASNNGRSKFGSERIKVTDNPGKVQSDLVYSDETKGDSKGNVHIRTRSNCKTMSVATDSEKMKLGIQESEDEDTIDTVEGKSERSFRDGSKNKKVNIGIEESEDEDTVEGKSERSLRDGSKNKKVNLGIEESEDEDTVEGKSERSLRDGSKNKKVNLGIEESEDEDTVEGKSERSLRDRNKNKMKLGIEKSDAKDTVKSKSVRCLRNRSKNKVKLKIEESEDEYTDDTIEIKSERSFRDRSKNKEKLGIKKSEAEDTVKDKFVRCLRDRSKNKVKIEVEESERSVRDGSKNKKLNLGIEDIIKNKSERCLRDRSKNKVKYCIEESEDEYTDDTVEGKSDRSFKDRSKNKKVKLGNDESEDAIKDKSERSFRDRHINKRVNPLGDCISWDEDKRKGTFVRPINASENKNASSIFSGNVRHDSDFEIENKSTGKWRSEDKSNKDVTFVLKKKRTRGCKVIYTNESGEKNDGAESENSKMGDNLTSKSVSVKWSLDVNPAEGVLSVDEKKNSKHGENNSNNVVEKRMTRSSIKNGNNAACLDTAAEKLSFSRERRAKEINAELIASIKNLVPEMPLVDSSEQKVFCPRKLSKQILKKPSRTESTVRCGRKQLSSSFVEVEKEENYFENANKTPIRKSGRTNVLKTEQKRWKESIKTDDERMVTKQRGMNLKQITEASRKKMKRASTGSQHDLDDESCHSGETEEARTKENWKKKDENALLEQKDKPATPKHALCAQLVRSPRLLAAKTSEKVAKPKILFTGVVNKSGEKILKKLGGELVSTVYECTHLVTDKVRRTVKFLCCLARGIPIVTPAWLEKCQTKGFFVDHTPFILSDPYSEKFFKFSLAKSCQKAARYLLLSGYKVFVTKSVKPEPLQMKDILKCAGAECLTCMPCQYMKNTLIISCDKDKVSCQLAMKVNIPVVDAEFILTGILWQQVNIDQHRLFTAAVVSRKRQSKDSSSSSSPKAKRRP